MSTVPVTVAVADLVTLTDPLDTPLAEAREAPHVQALVEAARRGSREAFADLVALNERVVFRTALAALRVREDAEDATQDAFIIAWQKLEGFRGDSTFRTWLLTIVWRKALDKRRQRQAWWNRVRSASPRLDDDVNPVELMSADGPDPERAIVSQDMAEHITRAIGRLSPRLRDTLLLCSSGEYSYDEVARILGVPLGTVKWRVAEARRLVRRRVPSATLKK